MWSVIYLCSTYLCLIVLSTTIQICNASLLEYQRRRPCGMTQGQCGTGECIEEEKFCDGIPDCHDNSDETENTCKDLHCPRFTFRCKYGACIRANSRCNGLKDCFDGSDEQGCADYDSINEGYDSIDGIVQAAHIEKTATLKPHLLVSCLIPNNPENGDYRIGGQKLDQYRTGDTVPSFSVLITNCDYGYQAFPADKIYSVCANGIWTPIPSTCSKFPQGIQSANSEICECHCPLVLIK